MKQDIYTRLVYARRMRLFGRAAYLLLKLLGLEIPRSVAVGPGLTIEHGGFGTVIHSSTIIGSRVKLYPGVTVGRADIYRAAAQSAFERVVIEDDVILSPGCKVLGKNGELRVGQGSVVGANAVLLSSTGPYEIWAGAPARLVGHRAADSIGQTSETDPAAADGQVHA
jgi:serine O-acetyltransferase